MYQANMYWHVPRKVVDIEIVLAQVVKDFPRMSQEDIRQRLGTVSKFYEDEQRTSVPRIGWNMSKERPRKVRDMFRTFPYAESWG